MYILCNNFLDGYRISQIAVFVLQTWYYVYLIFLTFDIFVWSESFHINYFWCFYYHMLCVPSRARSARAPPHVVMFLCGNVSIKFNLFAHKSGTPSRGFHNNNVMMLISAKIIRFHCNFRILTKWITKNMKYNIATF